MNVPLERGDSDARAENFVQVGGKRVKKMRGNPVALVNQRVVAVDDFDVRIRFVERCQIRIVQPERRAGCAHVDLELPGMRPVEITYRGGQHHNVARRLEIPQDQLAHEEI